ncbi:MAG: PH domain-containing protein [Aureliella sp.]
MIGDRAVLRASQWCYRGVWGVVTEWLRVPPTPPELAGADDSRVRAFRPAEGYLRYRKLFFWIGLAIVDIALTGAWLVLLFAWPLIGILLAVPFWIVIVVPDILVYIGLHLRYDTTWYVLSDRTLRLRRGIWVVHEVTITYENIQNVSIRQGPIQRLFGISDVLVETAGGGAVAGPHGEQALSGHQGLIEGIDNAVEVRELIMAKWRAARSAGLGDEPLAAGGRMSAVAAAVQPAAAWSGLAPREQRMLEEIRDLLIRLATPASS